MENNSSSFFDFIQEMGIYIVAIGLLSTLVLSAISFFNTNNFSDLFFAIRSNPFFLITQPFIDGFAHSNWLTLQIGIGSILTGGLLFIIGDKLN